MLSRRDRKSTGSSAKQKRRWFRFVELGTVTGQVRTDRGIHGTSAPRRLNSRENACGRPITRTAMTVVNRVGGFPIVKKGPKMWRIRRNPHGVRSFFTKIGRASCRERVLE